MRHLRMSVVLRVFAVVALCAIVGRSVVRGQRGRRERERVPPPSQLLQSVTRLNCSFVAAAQGVWQSDGPVAQVQQVQSPATVTIFNINAQDGTAEIGRGLFREADNVIVKLAGSTLHFLDIGLNGDLDILTVFAREIRDHRLQAVYSRTSYVERGFGAAAPPAMAQYYGDCAIQN